MNELIGGRDGVIYKDGTTMVRPLNTWSSTIHLLLTHLRKKGIVGCPEFMGKEDGNELLSYVEGETYNYPLSGSIASPTALASAARLLKSLHDASADFLRSYPEHDFHWMLSAETPHEVICHGDFTPYNVALHGDHVVGVFDFDAAHPASRVWDLAYSVYCWAPFKTDPGDALGTLSEQIVRARLFCDAYGATTAHREALVQMMMRRLTSLVDFMQSAAASGNQKFVANIEQGHHVSYLRDIEHLRQHKKEITQGLLVDR
ncbi:MAG: phosphotransferase [Natronospirillum sp.]